MNPVTEIHYHPNKSNIDQLKKDCEKLIAVADLIDAAETRAESNRETARNYEEWFPQMSKRFAHKCNISERAALRLRQYFNHLLAEVQA